MKQKIINSKAYAPRCEYCLHGKLTADGESVLCIKKGVMLPESSCRKYEYDPLKRKPKKRTVKSEFVDSDFSI
ncbi:MAG: hypothetical protein MJ177_11130 [Clostridia bacterium]|nr:hypothetical protein [Clostridia bacterium]